MLKLPTKRFNLIKKKKKSSWNIEREVPENRNPSNSSCSICHLHPKPSQILFNLHHRTRRFTLRWYLRHPHREIDDPISLTLLIPKPITQELQAIFCHKPSLVKLRHRYSCCSHTFNTEPCLALHLQRDAVGSINQELLVPRRVVAPTLFFCTR